MSDITTTQDTTSALAPATELPGWVVPASPESRYTTVGISVDGELYLYGETAASPGPVIPALLGVVTSATVNTHGTGSRYGSRDYLELLLATPIPGEFVQLNLPCKENPTPDGGSSTPWSVRSLLGALLELDLPNTAIKLQTKRGTSATFMRVIPHDASGTEQPDVRAESIGPSRDDLEIAVNHIRASLGQQPLFVNPYDR